MYHQFLQGTYFIYLPTYLPIDCFVSHSPFLLSLSSKNNHSSVSYFFPFTCTYSWRTWISHYVYLIYMIWYYTMDFIFSPSRLSFGGITVWLWTRFACHSQLLYRILGHTAYTFYSSFPSSSAPTSTPTSTTICFKHTHDKTPMPQLFSLT